MMNKKLTPFEGTKEATSTCLGRCQSGLSGREHVESDDVKDLAATPSVVRNAKLAAERPDKDRPKKNVKKAKGKLQRGRDEWVEVEPGRR